MLERSAIVKKFELFSVSTGGIGRWITAHTDPAVLDRLSTIDTDPLSAVQFNQLLVLGHEAPAGDAFFRYYWLEQPDKHPYDVTKLEGFSDDWLQHDAIASLDHLKWGLYRLYVDGLLYFGNVRTAYRELRELTSEQLRVFFEAQCLDTNAIKRRGPPLSLRKIAKDNRYLISEMACKSYGDPTASTSLDLREVLLAAYQAHHAAGQTAPTIRELLENRIPQEHKTRQQEFLFSADEVLDETVSSLEELKAKFDAVAEQFSEARNSALENTHLYLSMLSDLDVYMATSMRSRADFRAMADSCERIFADSKLKNMNLRYFDPTLSAAGGHEDKGLIECLMVKCAKILVYSAGEKESYGKDAEAAMALSLGKPVIFYCDQSQRSRFYREVHPLSRLIEFETGIVVGAIVTDNLEDVPELIRRIFENEMEYYLEKSASGSLRLKEKLTDSVVRLQTSDRLLNATFWNHYHRTQKKSFKHGVNLKYPPGNIYALS